ncbi:TPA: minor capsid protein [Streptococcus suis]
MASDDWKKRIRAEQLAKMERGATLGEEMDRLYSYHFNELEKEIRVFEQRYADKNGLSLAEVKARVDDFDVKAFEEKAKRYVAEKNFSARANSELALYNLKMKTNRLALLQYNLDLELIALAEDERNLTERFLNDEFVKAIETQSGLLGRSVLSASQIGTTAQAILNTPFHGANWSDNIWKRQTALREVVARMTERLLLQGKNPTTMVAQLRKEFNVTASEAKRLAVTEGARVATEGQKQAYIANGYDEYEFIAEPSACRECSKLDGKIFKVKDMEPGENAAPMHPWCHCSTGAHLQNDSALVSEGLHMSSSAFGNWKWPEFDRNNLISKEERNELTLYASERGITLQGIKRFDGDTELLKIYIDGAYDVLKMFPNLTFEERRPLTLKLGTMQDDDFAITRGHVIELNVAMFRDPGLLESRYQSLLDDGWFAQGTTYKSIIHHEMGHVIDRKLDFDSLSLAKEITNLSGGSLFDFIKENLSEYAGGHYDGAEIPSEALSSFMGDSPTDFTLQFVREVLKYR